jgi:ketosteroid isomerase-like protein
MKPRFAGLVLIALVALGSGCASLGAGGEADVRDQVLGVLRFQVEAWNRGDLEGFMDGYWRSPDLVFTSGGRVQRGWQTTLDRYRAAYGERTETMGTLSFSDLEIHALGRGSAWVLGRWALETAEGPRGGIFTLVLRDVEGRWVIVHDHTSESG